MSHPFWNFHWLERMHMSTADVNSYIHHAAPGKHSFPAVFNSLCSYTLSTSSSTVIIEVCWEAVVQMSYRAFQKLVFFF